MLLTVLEFLWFLQGEEVPAGGGGGGGGGGATDPQSCAMQIGLFGLMMVVFYFFLLRPEQKRRKEHEEMMKTLQKGTKVRTTGGLLGEIVSVTDDEVVLQIAERVRVNVLRSHVSAIESVRKAAAEKDKKPDEKKADEKKADEKKKDEPEAKAGEAQDET